MLSTKVREKSAGKLRSMQLLAVLMIPAVALVLGSTTAAAWDGDDGDEIPFDVAKLYFELNNTDEDLGIHGLVDGEPWDWLGIEDPRERQMLDIEVKGRLKRQGLTELFFESAEPSFEELSPEEFFRRFPRGWYEIEGETLEGDELESRARLSHKMPAPAYVELNGLPLVTADSDDCNEDEPVEVDEVTIAWHAVTRSHPDIGWPNNTHIDVVFYQIVVEYEDNDENVFVFNVEYAGEGEVTVPEGFLPEDAEFKIEVLVRAANNNQTAIESCPLVFAP